MILSTLERRQGRGPLDDFWYRPAWFGGAGSLKEASPGEALGLSAWWNALTVISGTMALLPLRLYRRQGPDRVPATDDPRYWMVFRKPTPWHTAFTWREMAQGHLLTRGNHYARKIRDRTDRTVSLEPIHPDRVRIETKAGRLVYVVERKSSDVLAAEDVFHLPGMGDDGICGYSVVTLARRSLGYALQLEQHGSEVMGNKARPGGVLSTEQILKPETKKDLRDNWDTQYTEGGIGRTAVLDAGLTWQQVGFSAEDAQFLQSRKFQVTEVARWTNLPPHFLKDLERATFSNIEQQDLEFAKYTIAPWVERWEQEMDLAFLDEDEREELFFKFDLKAMLRATPESRAAFYTSLFQMGSLSPNEIRRLEDMDGGVEGGDQRFVQVNLMPLDRASDPFGALDESGERALLGLEDRGAPVVEDRRRWERLERRSLRLRTRLMQTYRSLLTDAAGRLVRREVQDIGRILDAVDDGDVEEFLRRLEVWGEGLPDAVRSIMRPVLVSYIELVADAAAEEVEASDEIDPQRVVNWRESYIDSLTRGHTGETLGRLEGTVAVEGDPFGNARSMLDRWSENRAAEIGLREAVTAAGGIATTVYAIAGFGPVWRTTGSESCPYCKMLDGRRVGPGERFLEDGDTLDPDDADVEPLTVRRGVGHPQAHNGCDCTVSAAR